MPVTNRVTLDTSNMYLLSLDEVDRFDLVEDEVLIERIIYALAQGVRQADFLRAAFSAGGACPINFTNLRWSVEWKRSLNNMLERLLCLFSVHPQFVLIRTLGPRGGWWSGRFFIRKSPAPASYLVAEDVDGEVEVP